MKSMKNSVLLVLITAFVVGLASCAPPPARKKINLVWPLPPDEPRIEYVDRFTSTKDLGQKTDVAAAFFGDSGTQALNKPYGVAVDKKGNVYITDIGKVWVIDFKDKKYRFIGEDPGLGKLVFPVGVATASDGRVFVSDISQGRVFVYNGEGRVVGALGHKGEFKGAAGLAVDEKRNFLYVVDSKKHVIDVYALDTYKKIRTIGKRGQKDGEFNFPTNIAVGPEGRLYVTDTGNFRVQIFDAKGTFIRSIGKLGDSPGDFGRPKGVALDSEGHIYVIDTAFQNFQVFDDKGRLLLVVGGAGTDPGQFLLPAGIAIDNNDEIYVINQIPGSLQMFQYLSEKWKKRNPGSFEKIESAVKVEPAKKVEPAVKAKHAAKAGQ